MTVARTLSPEGHSGPIAEARAILGHPGAFAVRVCFDVHRLSLNRRLHWRERHRLNRVAKEAAALGWAQAGRPVVAGQVRVSVLIRRGRVLDEDNAWSGAKAARDFLFCGAITRDDSPKYVRLGQVLQETGKQWAGKEEVWFLVEPLTQERSI